MKSRTTSPPADQSYRFERKYQAWRSSPQELELMLKLHPAHFIDAYPPRFVNNIYLDSPGLANFITHVDGSWSRAKLRIRWYGDAHGHLERPVLEVKIKRGLVGTKRHYPLEPFDFDGSFDLEKVRSRVRAADSEADELLSTAGPALFNRYHRRYYRTADARFRMTMDTEMSFHVVNGRAWGPVSEYRERDLTILELKYDVGDDPDAGRIAAGLPFLLSKNSKYVYGIERLSGFRD
ncbi:MAG: VTC domain-containing protein [Myxococcota bacterium]|nr:VTC domain-containing protein [Myxococcota bacterium]